MKHAIPRDLSIRKGVRSLVLRISLASAIPMLSLFLFAFLLQVRSSLTSEVYSFLFSAKDTLISLQRELGYDDLTGYNYAAKHLKESFSFSDIQRADTAPWLDCLYRKNIDFIGERIDICLESPQQYTIILNLDTIKGLKHVILTKVFNPFSQHFALLIAVFACIALSFYLFLFWIYRQFLHLSIEPYSRLYQAIINKEVAFESPYLEIREIGKNISDSLENERQVNRLSAIVETIQMIVHDVRKPINMLKIIIKRMQAIPFEELPQYAAKNLPQIIKVSENVETMLLDLLDINQSTRLLRTNLNLRDFLDPIIERYGRIRLDVHSKLSIFADASKLSRIISNILDNAVEACRVTDDIWITATERDDKIFIEIGNMGSQLAPESLSQVFEAFWSRKKKDGHGLGLAISKKFVEEHGGKIYCESNGFCTSNQNIDRKMTNYVIFKIEIPITFSSEDSSQSALMT